MPTLRGRPVAVAAAPAASATRREPPAVPDVAPRPGATPRPGLAWSAPPPLRAQAAGAPPSSGVASAAPRPQLAGAARPALAPAPVLRAPAPNCRVSIPAGCPGSPPAHRPETILAAHPEA